MKAECKRCGKCCVVYNGKNWEDCQFLVRDGLKHTYCMGYTKRIGRDLGYGFVCGYRKDLHFNIPGCPYNKKGLNIHPAYK